MQSHVDREFVHAERVADSRDEPLVGPGESVVVPSSPNVYCIGQANAPRTRRLRTLRGNG